MIRRIGFCLAILAPLVAGRAAEAGPLSLEQFFRGRLTANGTVENLRQGGTRAFTMDMKASWDGPKGTLVQEVAFADGERQHKVWTFEKIGEGRFVGRRADLTRDADVVEDEKGVRMSYNATTPVPALGTLNLAFEERLTPVSRGVVAMQSDITFLFVSAARVTMTITRAGP